MSSNPKQANRFRHLLAASIAALLATTGLAACSSSNAGDAAASDAATLRLGYFANITHALPLIGIANGTYAKVLGSTKLETQVFNAGPAAVEALFAGAIDAAYVGPNPAINAFTKSNGEAIRAARAGGKSRTAFVSASASAQESAMTEA